MNWLKKPQQTHTSSRTTAEEEDAHTNILNTYYNHRQGKARVLNQEGPSNGWSMKQILGISRIFLLCQTWHMPFCLYYFYDKEKHSSQTRALPQKLLHRAGEKAIKHKRTANYFGLRNRGKHYFYSQEQQPRPAGSTAHVFVSITRATEKTRW